MRNNQEQEAPLPDEIAQRAAEIRKGWNATARHYSQSRGGEAMFLLAMFKHAVKDVADGLAAQRRLQAEPDIGKVMRDKLTKCAQYAEKSLGWLNDRSVTTVTHKLRVSDVAEWLDIDIDAMTEGAFRRMKAKDFCGLTDEL